MISYANDGPRRSAPRRRKPPLMSLSPVNSASARALASGRRGAAAAASILGAVLLAPGAAHAVTAAGSCGPQSTRTQSGDIVTCAYTKARRRRHVSPCPPASRAFRRGDRRTRRRRIPRPRRGGHQLVASGALRRPCCTCCPGARKDAHRSEVGQLRPDHGDGGLPRRRRPRAHDAQRVHHQLRPIVRRGRRLVGAEYRAAGPRAVLTATPPPIRGCSSLAAGAAGHHSRR